MSQYISDSVFIFCQATSSLLKKNGEPPNGWDSQGRMECLLINLTKPAALSAAEVAGEEAGKFKMKRIDFSRNQEPKYAPRSEVEFDFKCLFIFFILYSKKQNKTVFLLLSLIFILSSSGGQGKKMTSYKYGVPAFSSRRAILEEPSRYFLFSNRSDRLGRTLAPPFQFPDC